MTQTASVREPALGMVRRCISTHSMGDLHVLQQTGIYWDFTETFAAIKDFFPLVLVLSVAENSNYKNIIKIQLL